MIFGWLENGQTDRWVLVDAIFPWPALHNGRNALRSWANLQNQRRALDHTPGPRRMPWPCKAVVKDHGDAELHVWPCEIYAKPRQWCADDRVWRAQLTELAEHVAADIGCPVTLMWMGGETIERAVTSPGLAGRGFLCWGKGERAPNFRRIKELKEQPLRAGASGADIRIMPQGEGAWR
jgi:hypothetical protein